MEWFKDLTHDSPLADLKLLCNKNLKDDFIFHNIKQTHGPQRGSSYCWRDQNQLRFKTDELNMLASNASQLNVCYTC